MEEKLFYSIGEIAEELGENVSLVRYWSNVFSKHVKPSRTRKGNRQFTVKDVDTLRRIHHLVKVQGLTLEGAEKALSSGSPEDALDRKVRALNSLKQIRARLVEIKSSL